VEGVRAAAYGRRIPVIALVKPPVLRPLNSLRPRYELGQLGITDTLAQSIVSAAEPVTRAIIADERTKFAQAMMIALVGASGSLISYISTRYFVPDRSKLGKGIGYSLSAVFLGGGALLAVSSLPSPPAPPKPPPQGGGVLTQTAQDTATAIVNAAEPKIRSIVEDERNRLVAALLETLPLAGVGVLTAIGTWILVSEKKPWAKAAGYSAATAITALGLYFGLSKEATA